VHDRRAEAAHDPRAQPGIRRVFQVVEFSTSAKPPRRRSEDRRVDQEADAMQANQQDDDDALEQLLRQRGDIPGEAREVDRECIERERVDDEARARRHHAAADDGDDGAERHQLVAVQIEQRREEAEHRQRGHQRGQQELHRHGGAAALT